EQIGSSYATFSSLIKQSSFGALTDGQTFWYNINNNPSYYNEVKSYPSCIYSNLCVLITANLSYWHENAQSNPDISATIPKDLYTQMKRVSAWSIDFLPEWFGYILPFHLLLPYINSIILLSTAFIRGFSTIRISPQDSSVQAVTGSGKSVMLPIAALTREPNLDTIFINKNNERDSPLLSDNTLDNPIFVHKITRSTSQSSIDKWTQDGHRHIFIMTYAHEQQWETLILYQEMKKNKVYEYSKIIMMTATPVLWDWVTSHWTADAQDPVDNYVWGKETLPKYFQPHESFIRVVAMQEVVFQLSELSILTHVISRATQDQKPDH
ncbi:14138_t:CDS:2, partial [Racocetra persica]